MTKVTLHEIEIDPSQDIDAQITEAFDAIVAKHQAECPDCKAAAAEEKLASNKDAAERNPEMCDEKPKWPFPKTESTNPIDYKTGGEETAENKRQPIGYAAFLNGNVIGGSMRVEKAEVQELIDDRLKTETGRILGMFFGVPEVKPVFGE